MAIADSHHFARLPSELQIQVVSYIRSPADLVSLSLVSKPISPIALAQLYRHIHLSPQSRNHRNLADRIKILAESSQTGRIRSLEVGDGEILAPRFCRALHCLFQSLPKDCLEEYKYGSEGRPEADDMVHLWRTQKNLKNLQLDFYFNAPSIIEVARHHKTIFEDFRSLIELEIDFSEEKDQSSILSLLSTNAFRTVQRICLSTGLEYDQNQTFDGEFLAEYLPSDCLKHITLGGFDLPDSGYWDLNGYSHLKSLKLYNCHNLAPSLDSYIKPGLKCLAVQFAEDVSDADYCSVVSLLGRITELETLIFDNHKAAHRMNIETMLSRRKALIAAIGVSRKTLAHLLLDGVGRNKNGGLLQKEIMLCTRLRQLALELDTDTLEGQCKSILEQVPDLEILNIYIDLRTAPSLAGAGTALDDPTTQERQYDSARRWADAVFKTRPEGSRLKAFIFGRDYTFWDLLVKMECRDIPRQWFVPATQQSIRTYAGDRYHLGIQRPNSNDEIHAAVRLGSGMQRYVVPGYVPNVGVMDHKVDF